jgi:hypothetical protein
VKTRFLSYLAAFLLLASFLEGCAAVNTMVSLKYETGYPVSKNDCISSVTGTDLCFELKCHKAISLGSLLTWVGICVFAVLRKKPLD